MKALPFWILYFLLAGASEAKRFWKCQLAQIFLNAGLDGYAGYFLEDWMCTVYHESGYDTTARRIYQGYGLFQFNHRIWCLDKRIASHNICNICCIKFIDDDITDDILCAKKIADTPRGLEHFEMWRDHCKGKNIHGWVKDCWGLKRKWTKV